MLKYSKYITGRFGETTRGGSQIELVQNLKSSNAIRLTMLHQIINEIANLPNKGILIPADTRTRSKHGHKLTIMTNNTNQYKYSFFPRTISQWSCLLKSLVDSETVDAFQYVLKGLNSPL